MRERYQFMRIGSQGQRERKAAQEAYSHSDEPPGHSTVSRCPLYSCTWGTSTDWRLSDGEEKWPMEVNEEIYTGRGVDRRILRLATRWTRTCPTRSSYRGTRCYTGWNAYQPGVGDGTCGGGRDAWRTTTATVGSARLWHQVWLHFLRRFSSPTIEEASIGIGALTCGFGTCVKWQTGEDAITQWCQGWGDCFCETTEMSGVHASAVTAGHSEGILLETLRFQWEVGEWHVLHLGRHEEEVCGHPRDGCILSLYGGDCGKGCFRGGHYRTVARQVVCHFWTTSDTYDGPGFRVSRHHGAVAEDLCSVPWHGSPNSSLEDGIGRT